MKWYDYVLGVLSNMPPKAWIFLVGLFIGIPTSIYGVQWAGYKIAKQDTNCNSDLYLGLAERNPGDPQRQLDNMTGQFERYTNCRKSVDPDIGSVEFVRKELERSRDR